MAETAGSIMASYCYMETRLKKLLTQRNTYTNDGVEDTEHFLLHCPSFDEERCALLAGDFSLLRPFGYINPSHKVLTKLLLLGNKDLPDDVNRDVLQLTLKNIHKSSRLYVVVTVIFVHVMYFSCPGFNDFLLYISLC